MFNPCDTQLYTSDSMNPGISGNRIEIVIVVQGFQKKRDSCSQLSDTKQDPKY